MMKYLIAMVLLLCIGTAVFIYLHHDLASYHWDIQQVGYSPADQTPLNSITLMSDATSVIYPLPGNYIGSCTVMNASQLLPGELSGVICISGASGIELGVFDSGGYKRIQKIQRVGITDTSSPGTRAETPPEFVMVLNSSE
jgi:hypothetical protein